MINVGDGFSSPICKVLFISALIRKLSKITGTSAGLVAYINQLAVKVSKTTKYIKKSSTPSKKETMFAADINFTMTTGQQKEIEYSVACVREEFID